MVDFDWFLAEWTALYKRAALPLTALGIYSRFQGRAQQSQLRRWEDPSLWLILESIWTCVLEKKFLRLTFNTSSLILASNLNAWLGKRPSVCLLINTGDGIESNLVITIAVNLFEMTYLCDDIGDTWRKSKPATKMYNMKQICVLLFIYVTVVLGNPLQDDYDVRGKCWGFNGNFCWIIFRRVHTLHQI